MVFLIFSFVVQCIISFILPVVLILFMMPYIYCALQHTQARAQVGPRGLALPPPPP